jgi:hypothetical protein
LLLRKILVWFSNMIPVLPPAPVSDSITAEKITASTVTLATRAVRAHSFVKPVEDIKSSKACATFKLGRGAHKEAWTKDQSGT